MSDQTQWERSHTPPPPRTLSHVLKDLNKLADWYAANNPGVQRIAVSVRDYHAIEAACGTCNITRDGAGLHYRGFLIFVAPRD